MANIQKALDALQPYVIGIRYLADGLIAVDTIFKEGWTVPDDKFVKKEKGPDDSMNYYMLYSDIPSVGLDEILAYVDRTIKFNIEKEKKYDLFRIKGDELKELFKKHPLAKLKNLRFTFIDDPVIPDINQFDLDDDLDGGNIEEEPNWVQPYEEEEYVEPAPIQPHTYLDENQNPIPLSEEDKEILAEEARAERNRQAIKNKKTMVPAKKANVELPPRRKGTPIPPISQEPVNNGYCMCGPDEACDKCIDTKY